MSLYIRLISITGNLPVTDNLPLIAQPGATYIDGMNLHNVPHKMMLLTCIHCGFTTDIPRVYVLFKGFVIQQ